MNDELTEVECRIQKLEFDNVVLQVQKDVYESQLQKCQDRIQDLMQNRHVPKAEDHGLDTIAIIIEKNSTLNKMSFMSTFITSQEYKNGMQLQRRGGLELNILTTIS